MKLFEIRRKKEVQVEPEKPSMFLRPQAGYQLTDKDRAAIKRKLKRGYIPKVLKKQAE